MKITGARFIFSFIFGAVTLSAFQNGAGASGSFCPRLEGVNLDCASAPIPGSGSSCTPSTSPTLCYTCSGQSTQTTANFSSECKSWNCKIELSPEGLPRKTAVCGTRSTCCFESIAVCCQSIQTSSGSLTVNSDCSQSISCAKGSQTAPLACSIGGNTSCQGAAACTGNVSPPADCQ